MSKSNDTCLGCLVFFIVAAIMTSLLENIVGAIITIIVIILLVIIIRKMYWYSLSEEERDRRILRKQEREDYIKNLEMDTGTEFRNKLNFSINGSKTNLYNNNSYHSIRIWKNKDKIYFYHEYIFKKIKHDIKNFEYIDRDYDEVKNEFLDKFFRCTNSINIDDIEYFKLTGEILSNIKGGGSDLGGAIIGGVLAGGAGAVIGSRKEINTEFIDNKRTILVYKVNGNVKQLEFDKNFYNKLLSWVPEKNYDYIVLNPNENKSKNHKEDIISDEEFKELEVINKIKNKYNINNPETAKSILDKCNNILKTDIGIDFINELKRNSEHL